MVKPRDSSVYINFRENRAWLLIAFASGVEMVYAGRCISGFCVGVASLCIPVYLGETVQPEVRGRLELMASTIGNAGILLSFVGGKFMDWSKLALVGSVVPVIIFVCMLLIPETPRWYISKNKVTEARTALEWLRSKEANIDLELNNIRESHSQSVKDTGNTWELFKKHNLKLLFIAIGLMFFEQMSGIDAVIYYTALIFKASGSTIDDNLSTIIVGVVNCTSTLIATFLIDNLGRKILLYISAATMTVSLTVLGTFFYMKDSGYDVTEYGSIPLTSFVFFVVGFSLGLGPVPWLMLGEILPAKVRGPAASLVTVCTWGFAFIVTNSFLHVIKILGTCGTFWMFACICFISIVFVFFYVPETKGQSLEDIEEKLRRAHNPVYSRGNSILQEIQ
ncbi:facilitated trehalose transporter Tret1-like isoform X2 [Bacillus rossius redtenbacheri]|uniref:facilitated trehalose transporter Tret1-like isoform X2 n=1 Tax=Bacillus rossius redtenbacheri TaxID=93214 RepID=UPI002FDC8AC8